MNLPATEVRGRLVVGAGVVQLRLDPCPIVTRANPIECRRYGMIRAADAGIGECVAGRALRLHQHFAVREIRC